MNIKLVLIAFFAVVSLSSCETIQQIKAENDQRLLNRAKDSCISYGFKESSDSFSYCIQKEINERKNRAAIESAAKEVNDK
jgi:hypothetical protein